MRVSRDEMDKSHQRIVEGASRLLRERGIESTSVADVMGDAGLTNGGFYRHFKTKEALVAAALQRAFEQGKAALEARFEKYEPNEAVADYRAHYLTKGHVDRPGIGCPLAALAGDVARGSDALKIAFGAGVNRLVGMLSRGFSGSARDRQVKATRELAMLVGAVSLARASDPETARTILAACRADVERD
jgi:TetR/AcrR family transcriptional repressor of nem operon